MESSSKERRPDTVRSDQGDIDYQGLTGAVRELVNVMKQGDLNRMEVEQGELRIVLSAREQHIVSHAPSHTQGGNSNIDHSSASAGSSGTLPEDESVHIITSPMVGTFYAASGPGEESFVQVGDRIDVGQTVAIIEAMKIMNEIASDTTGTVEEILVANAESVEFGHPLMRIRLDG